VDIGVFAPFASPMATPEFVHAVGTELDGKGFSTLWVAEHVVLFDEYDSEYPYSEDGKIPAGGEVGIMDPFVVLSYLASCTERIRLATGICLVPQRNPVYTAKETAGIDWLSGGRLDFGVGVGWLAEEFQACATSFERRGKRTREYLEVIKTLWCDAVSEHHGEFYDLPACRMYPKPLQDPHPPIIFGGESDPALRRVAEIGQGWYGYNHDPATAAERIETLGRMLAENERSLEDVKIYVSPYLRPTTLDDVKRLRDLGVDEVIFFLLAGDADEAKRASDDLAEEFVEPCRSL
jgi:probable F420-dependent oxidoreductase